jgi:hypothetical protein
LRGRRCHLIDTTPPFQTRRMSWRGRTGKRPAVRITPYWRKRWRSPCTRVTVGS